MNPLTGALSLPIFPLTGVMLLYSTLTSLPCVVFAPAAIVVFLVSVVALPLDPLNKTS